MIFSEEFFFFGARRQFIFAQQLSTTFFFVRETLSPIQNLFTFHCMQGDQIGRIFAFWAIVYIGQFFLKLQK
jgi:hypothetical protein